MKKIDKKYFIENIKNLFDNNIIPLVPQNNINEFKIGKNYFYKIIINAELIKVQKWLSNYFQEMIPLNNAAVAFRKELSYLHLFEPHRKNYHFLRLDIRSFFHSIQVDDIRLVFQEYFITEKDLKKSKKVDAYIDDEMKQTLLDAFINIVTYMIPEESANEKFKGKQVLPMGFITSPMISNVIFRKLDIQIQKFCAERNIIYTRYADDMLFSSDKDMGYVHSDNFINEMNILISQMDFKLNKKKTIKAKHTISLNGYTIQYSKFNKVVEIFDEEKIINEFRLSNKKLAVITKMIYMIEVEKKSSMYILKKIFNYKLPEGIPSDKVRQFNNDQLLNKLTGYRSYLLSIVKFNKQYECCQDYTIRKYLGMIEKLERNISHMS